MSKLTANEIAFQISTGLFSPTELSEISNAVQYARTRTARTVKCDLYTGAKVSFNSVKLGGIVQGKVIKVNPKKVRVMTEKDGLWNVPASMLNIVE